MEGVSILKLARVHHEVLLEALRETPHEELVALATAASEFFLEVLASYDMTQRAFFEDTLSAGPGTSGTAGSPGRESGPGDPGTDG
jgi:hypothetical protein